MTIREWLAHATTSLDRAGISSARLDALLLLSDECNRPKAWLLAHPEQQIDTATYKNLTKKLAQRTKRQPMAYLRGVQEFFGREFAVSSDVLIPRPETETLVEQLLSLPKHPHDRLIDVGTGSGAIAITAKLEVPSLHVYATDVSIAALDVAQKNAKRLGATVHFAQSDLLQQVSDKSFQFITANLPYVADHWQRSVETNYEPPLALFAADDGLALIKKLVVQSTDRLTPDGYLLLESDPRQHQAIATFATEQGLHLHTAQHYILVFTKK